MTLITFTWKYGRPSVHLVRILVVGSSWHGASKPLIRRRSGIQVEVQQQIPLHLVELHVRRYFLGFPRLFLSFCLVATRKPQAAETRRVALDIRREIEIGCPASKQATHNGVPKKLVWPVSCGCGSPLRAVLLQVDTISFRKRLSRCVGDCYS